MDIQDWRSFLLPYNQAVDELVVKFQHIASEYRNLGKYSPIEQVQGRVKSISSILEKMAKQDIAFEELEDRMSDMAGIRLICQFVEDIDLVVELIRDRKDMVVIEETNYIDHKKESGYRSYHMIILYPVYTILGPKSIRAEIQIRTLGMNFWSIIEHSLSYKYRKTLPDQVKERLIQAAEAAFSMDKEMSAIRYDIMEAQSNYQTKAKLVSDLMNNIQNVYENDPEKKGMQDAQEKLLSIVKEDKIDEIRNFNKELDTLAQEKKVQKLSD